MKQRHSVRFRIGWRECAVMGAVLVAAAFLLLYEKEIKGEDRWGWPVFAKWKAEQAAVQQAHRNGYRPAEKTYRNRYRRIKGTYGVERTEENEKGKVALTFDDGPHPQYTEQLLDGLKKREVRATFFVTGEHAELHPEIIKRMSDEGHCVGNHTYSHIQLKDSNKEAFKQELIKTNEIITGITGEEVLYVRPPYGTWDKKFETELNMFPVLWSVDPLDWCSDNVSCITDKVVKKVRENDIILMHDYYDTSVTAALNIVDELLEEGYEFVTVEEILFD